jgi:peptidoglycan/LPS O-acetylase OafA/YrhL
MSMKRLALLLPALVILTAFSAALQPLDAAYLQSFEKWKSELIDDLKQNWLHSPGCSG